MNVSMHPPMQRILLLFLQPVFSFSCRGSPHENLLEHQTGEAARGAANVFI